MNDPRRTARLDTKITIVLAERLGIAEAANAAAVLALSTSAHSADLGPEAIDSHGLSYGQIDQHPIPILEGSQSDLSTLHLDSATNDSPLHVVAFTDLARRARDYGSYLADLSSTDPRDNPYVGILVRGPRTRVNRATKHLRLFGSSYPTDTSDRSQNPESASSTQTAARTTLLDK